MFDTDPPTSIDSLNPQVTYRKPSRGTMKFEDGEVVTYTCSNPSKEDIFVNRASIMYVDFQKTLCVDIKHKLCVVQALIIRTVIKGLSRAFQNTFIIKDIHVLNYHGTVTIQS